MKFYTCAKDSYSGSYKKFHMNSISFLQGGGQKSIENPIDGACGIEKTFVFNNRHSSLNINHQSFSHVDQVVPSTLMNSRNSSPDVVANTFCVHEKIDKIWFVVNGWLNITSNARFLLPLVQTKHLCYVRVEPGLHLNANAACENEAIVQCRCVTKARQTAFGCATNMFGKQPNTIIGSWYIKENSHTICLRRVDSLPWWMPNSVRKYHTLCLASHPYMLSAFAVRCNPDFTCSLTRSIRSCGQGLRLPLAD